MALTFVSAVGDNGAITSGKRSFSVTRAAGEGFILVVLFKHTWGPAEEITGVKWDTAGDNQSFTQAAARVHSVSNRRSALFYLPAPTSVKTGSVEVTTAAADDADRNLYCLLFKVSGHDTTTMLTGTAVDRSETDAVTNDLPVTISSQVGDLVVAMGSMTANGAYIDAGDAANYNENTDSALTVFGGTKAGAASVTVTFGYSDVTHYDNALYAVSIAEAAGSSATITLTDPVAVVTGSTASCTITRSTAASGTITYNLTSSATGVATVPATATILDGQTTGSFNITGVSAGSSTITATNAADSGETDTATANVSALKGINVTFGQTGLTGLTFAWFDQASPDLFAAPTVVGTTESTDGSGVLEIDLTGTSVSVGNTGFLLIYKAGATAPDDLAFFGRLTVQDIG